MKALLNFLILQFLQNIKTQSVVFQDWLTHLSVFQEEKYVYLRFECSLPLAQCGLIMKIILSSLYSRPKICKNCILVRPYLNSKNNNLVYLFYFFFFQIFFLLLVLSCQLLILHFIQVSTVYTQIWCSW